MRTYSANSNGLLTMYRFYQLPNVQCCDILPQLLSSMMVEWLGDLIWLKIPLVSAIAFEPVSNVHVTRWCLQIVVSYSL